MPSDMRLNTFDAVFKMVFHVNHPITATAVLMRSDWIVLYKFRS